MELSQLSVEKENWQNRTFDKIKNQLFETKDNRFLRYDLSEEKYLVMVYGNAQVGKTTLILNVIGLKDEFFKEVHDVLRAGISRGNSSTSTAIVYSKSSEERYGFAISSFDEMENKEFELMDGQELGNKLQDIREKVEDNKESINSVIYIQLPKHFFVDDPNSNCISIIDLPGIESRNHKEKLHVQSLISKYLPISSACIIVCESNKIQSLQTMELPNISDWKNMEHRFVLAITYAYINGDTKKYFDTKKKDRENSFYDYVKREYYNAIRCEEILGKNNKIEIYPLDFGDSLTQLCTMEIKNKGDIDEVLYVKDKILKDLRETIVNRKGEKLKSAIQDLKVISECNIQNRISDYEIRKIDLIEEIEEIEKYIKSENKRLEKLKSDDEENQLDTKITKLKIIKKELDSLSIIDSNLDDEICGYISSSGYWCTFTFGENYLIHADRVVNAINSKVAEEVDSCFNEFDIILEENDGTIESYDRDKRKVKDEVLKAVNEYSWSLEKGISNAKIKFQVNRVYKKDVIDVCKSIKTEANKIKEKYIRSWKGKIEKDERECEKLKDEHIDKKRILKERIETKKKEKKSKEEELKSVEDSINILQNEKDNTQKTINQYKKMAKQAFEEEREIVINEINNCEKAEDKFIGMLLLGLVDKDYRYTLGGN